MTSTEIRLLHLLGVRALWPHTGREEFPTELHLNKELTETLARFDNENVNVLARFRKDAADTKEGP